jgi:hypothetical protein
MKHYYQLIKTKENFSRNEINKTPRKSTLSKVFQMEN